MKIAWFQTFIRCSVNTVEFNKKQKNIKHVCHRKTSYKVNTYYYHSAKQNWRQYWKKLLCRFLEAKNKEGLLLFHIFISLTLRIYNSGVVICDTVIFRAYWYIVVGCLNKCISDAWFTTFKPIKNSYMRQTVVTVHMPCRRQPK